MNSSVRLVACCIAIFSTPLLAADYVVNVNGIVCEFCSLGVAKKVARLAFIDRSRLDNGVEVDIENQMVTVAVKEGATLDKEALFAAIESGGYKPVEMWKLDSDGARIKLQP